MKDRFVFYSKSADKKPGEYKGKGWSEYTQNSKKIYRELSKVKDWRKQLSNMYICPFKLDGNEWNTVEHFFHAAKFRNKYPSYYKTFTINGKRQWSQDPFKSKQAGKAGRLSKAGRVYRNSKLGVPTNVKMRKDFYDRNIYRKAMILALCAKFTQCPELKLILLLTGDAELYHIITERGKKSRLERWGFLENIRECIRQYNNYDLSKITNFPSAMITKVLT